MADPGRDAACTLVWQRFPPLRGSRPAVQRVGPNWVYVFSAASRTGPGGKSVRQVVRVTVNGDGSVVKVTTSR